MFNNVKLTNRLSFLIGAIAVFLLMVSLVYYGVNNWFRITRVVVSGNVPNLTEDLVTKLISNRLTGTYFTLNIASVQKEFEKVAWVKSVHVEREFPDTIHVNIVEYVPIINLGHGKLLSKEKFIFKGYDIEKKLPLFTTPDSQIENALLVYEQLKPFMLLHNFQLNSLEYSGVGLTKIGFKNELANLNITMCSNNISSELVVLNKYWEQVFQIESKITLINMCYKNALAIR